MKIFRERKRELCIVDCEMLVFACVTVHIPHSTVSFEHIYNG